MQAIHEPYALRGDRDGPPAWLHGDSPYGELLSAAHDGRLTDVLADGVDPDEAIRALRGLAVPSDYSTRGIDYVTHVPIPFLTVADAQSPASRLLGESNRAVVGAELREADRDETGDDLSDVVESRTGGWMGSIETLSVRPFCRDDDGRWTLTPAWVLVVRWAQALADYPVADDEDHGERELDYMMDVVRDALRIDYDERYDDEDPSWLHELACDLMSYWGVDVSYENVEHRAREDYGWTPDEDS